jgi:recombination protein RecT
MNDIVVQAKDQFKEIAAKDRSVTWEEEYQFATQALAKNTFLASSNPSSICDSVINVASIGLTLNPANGFAYLVPEKIKIGKDYVQVCQLRVSFRGLVKIATDSKSIKWVRSEIVKENDLFEYNGPCSMPSHSMDAFGDRGKTVGVYCVAKTPEGDYLCDVMGLDEINKCMSAAKTKQVWQQWFDEMAKKAIIKRASKQWPIGDGSDRLSHAVHMINENEGSELKDPKSDSPRNAAEVETVNDDELAAVISLCKQKGIEDSALCAKVGCKSLECIPRTSYVRSMNWLGAHGDKDES